MIKIYYKKLGALATQNALDKLGDSPMRTPEAFRIKNIVKAAQAGVKKLQDELHGEILPTFSAATGRVQQKPQGKSLELGLPFNVKDGKEEEAKKVLADFGERFIEIKSKKIDFKLLFEVNEWTPSELEALEDVIEEPAAES